MLFNLPDLLRFDARAQQLLDDAARQDSAFLRICAMEAGELLLTTDASSPRIIRRFPTGMRVREELAFVKWSEGPLSVPLIGPEDIARVVASALKGLAATQINPALAQDWTVILVKAYEDLVAIDFPCLTTFLYRTVELTNRNRVLLADANKARFADRLVRLAQVGLDLPQRYWQRHTRNASAHGGFKVNGDRIALVDRAWHAHLRLDELADLVLTTEQLNERMAALLVPHIDESLKDRISKHWDPEFRR